MTDDANDLNAQIKERFGLLPKVIQNAITSADVSQRMRRMADTYDLHLDQWEKLENEVHLALLGFQPIEKLSENIRREVGVREEAANALADDIAREIFEPIREQLEQELEHPEAAKTETPTNAGGGAAQAAPAPATPPAPPPNATAQRGPASGTYVPGEASSERKSVADDPYREPPA